LVGENALKGQYTTIMKKQTNEIHQILMSQHLSPDSKRDVLMRLEHVRESLEDARFLLSNNKGLLQQLIITKDKIIFDFDKFSLLYKSVSDSSIIFKNLIFLEYESEIMILLKNILDSFSVFIDIGSNVGLHSMYAVSLGTHHVYSFEANPHTYKHLLENVIYNKLNKNQITTLNYAVGEEESESLFFDDLENRAASSFQRLYNNHDYQELFVKVVTIDSLNIGKVDLIKIDIEGSELFSIRGALNTIKRTHPIIIVEMLRKWSRIHGYQPNEIISLLEELDYNCYEIVDFKLSKIYEVTEDTIATNFLFVHEKKLSIIDSLMDALTRRIL
jgi:FkbM family methyltransferase